MGQKVSPHGLRVGVIKDWNSKWYGDKKNFADFLAEDNQIREYVKKKLYVAGVSKVLIERSSETKLRVIVLTAKPGMVIGRSGDGIEALKKGLVKLTGKEVEISIEEVRRSELDAQLTAEAVAQSLDRDEVLPLVHFLQKARKPLRQQLHYLLCQLSRYLRNS